MKNKTVTLKTSLTLFFTYLLCFGAFSQDWEEIQTPVTSNLILFDITFPLGQNEIGYTCGATGTWNAKGKILMTSNQGADWEIIYENETNGTGITAILFLDLNKGFAGTQGGDLMKTTDGGVNWAATDFDLNNNQGEVHDIKFFDTNNGAILTAWGGVYITADGGDTWTQASTNVPGAAYELAYADASNLFVVGNQQSIYKSEDGGYTWTANYSGPLGFAINQGVNFFDSNNGFVTGEEGNIFVTTDGGDNWSNYTIPNQGGLMRGALMVDENLLYITTTPGAVYKSTNGGVDWTLDSPINSQPSYYKIIMTDNGNLFVSGSGSTGGTILRKLGSTPPLTSNNVISNPLCNGDESGSITITVEGGEAPYSYDWSNGETTETISDLAAGIYSCTITDALGSIFIIENLLVEEPLPVDISATTTDETLLGSADGFIDIVTSGGIPPFAYLWSNGETTEDLENLEGGEYCLTITDSNACESITCETVIAGPSSIGNIPNLSSFNLLPNPIFGNNLLNIQLQFSTKTSLQIELINANGQISHSISRNDINTINEEIETSAYSPGVYFVKILDLTNHKYTSKKFVKME